MFKDGSKGGLGPAPGLVGVRLPDWCGPAPGLVTSRTSPGDGLVEA